MMWWCFDWSSLWNLIKIMRSHFPSFLSSLRLVLQFSAGIKSFEPHNESSSLIIFCCTILLWYRSLKRLLHAITTHQVPVTHPRVTSYISIRPWWCGCSTWILLNIVLPTYKMITTHHIKTVSEQSIIQSSNQGRFNRATRINNIEGYPYDA